MEADQKFEPAAWLATWEKAGGAWSGKTLILPTPNPHVLKRMVRDLGSDEIIALAAHMGVDAEVDA
ncbi:hypothetical protein [Sphingopyxis sp.]|uniref:hypothetical protein n=1 Tax=Sphingopyxis sp. TaxID=1908224 RepID=UPI001D92DA8B|nr:hypothetical protein [Sphingopyxis sp.]MBW8296179.1 hypothetical protein [Sphingopyxis sp.]